ncbi:MAG: type III-A CRISPR-associated protein Csm2 [Bacteroidetes bacterium]|nr:type III-A CRISPR-associated protein Csm2 [Bacteroidota bacterium]
MRNYYSEVKRIQMKGLRNNEADFLLLKPKLAYSAVKAKRKGALLFQERMEEAHAAVDSGKPDAEKRFKNFCDLLEAILAYHKVHDEKKDKR